MLVFLPFLTAADLQGSFPNLYFICMLIKNLFMLSVRISSYGWTPPTIYDFNSSVIFKHLKACLHNANNKRLGENARVKRSCLIFFYAFILTNNLEQKPRDSSPVEAGILKYFFSTLFFNCILLTCEDHSSSIFHLLVNISDQILLRERINLVKFVGEKVKVCYGLTSRLVNSAEVDLITMSGVPRGTIEDCFFL